MTGPPPQGVRRATADGCCAVQEAELLRRRLTDSDARIGYRITVYSSGAASVCKRASTRVGHTNVSRVPHRGPASSDAQQDVGLVLPLLVTSSAKTLDQTAGRGSTSRPIAHRKAAISRAIAAVTTPCCLPRAASLR